MAITGLACFEAKENHRLLHPPPSIVQLKPAKDDVTAGPSRLTDRPTTNQSTLGHQFLC
jgi:hypothetical protein